MIRALILFVPALFLVAQSPAAAPSPGFDRFVRATGVFCVAAPSTECVARTFDGLDTDGDGELSPVELATAKGELAAWTAANGERLPPEGRHGLSLALHALDLVGLERLIYLNDTDGSGGLTFEEATQDLRLDERPIGQIYLQGRLIDWARIRAMLGPSAFLLDYLDLL